MAFQIYPYDAPPSPVRARRLAPPGEEILVYTTGVSPQNYVLSRTNDTVLAGTGNPDYVMGHGTPAEVDQQIFDENLLPEAPEPDIPWP